ncbi:hypothetical protein NE236_18985 [Actinoallomurus purpureus]|uniref:hypothetical protein n=1 Tax=Actinoallomurus purpureus TaxID=478114 RepID=UPI0020940241|nr:hypothetical protein [Actinoallomurus purpureus]MCO6007072.1 hypothetical protein [Actinoallomurus purpureus]
MKYKLIPALAAPALALGLVAPSAQAATPQAGVKIAAARVAVTKGGGSVYGEAHYGNSGGPYLKVVDFTARGGWRIRGSIEKAYRGDWVMVFQCTAADGDFSTCRHSIPEGTLIRAHVWAYKGSTTKYHGYSAQTRV